MELSFTSPQSRVHPSFWESVFQLKMNTWHNSPPQDIRVSYEYEEKIDTFAFEAGSFTIQPQQNTCAFLIVNTIEEFKALDKNELLATQAKGIWEKISNSDMSISAPQCVLLCFADLKTHQFTYWFGVCNFCRDE